MSHTYISYMGMSSQHRGNLLKRGIGPSCLIPETCSQKPLQFSSELPHYSFQYLQQAAATLTKTADVNRREQQIAMQRKMVCARLAASISAYIGLSRLGQSILRQVLFELRKRPRLRVETALELKLGGCFTALQNAAKGTISDLFGRFRRHGSITTSVFAFNTGD